MGSCFMSRHEEEYRVWLLEGSLWNDAVRAVGCALVCSSAVLMPGDIAVFAEDLLVFSLQLRGFSDILLAMAVQKIPSLQKRCK